MELVVTKVSSSGRAVVYLEERGHLVAKVGRYRVEVFWGSPWDVIRRVATAAVVAVVVVVGTVSVVHGAVEGLSALVERMT